MNDTHTYKKLLFTHMCMRLCFFFFFGYALNAEFFFEIRIEQTNQNRRNRRIFI
jgi:hypothetical protein